MTGEVGATTQPVSRFAPLEAWAILTTSRPGVHSIRVAFQVALITAACKGAMQLVRLVRPFRHQGRNLFQICYNSSPIHWGPPTMAKMFDVQSFPLSGPPRTVRDQPGLSPRLPSGKHVGRALR